jgi:succinate-acetate transporter protein
MSSDTSSVQSNRTEFGAFQGSQQSQLIAGATTKMNDTAWTIAFASFGAWWLVAPESVIRFYHWFHRRSRSQVQMPKPMEIRLLGLSQITLVVCVAVWH